MGKLWTVKEVCRLTGLTGKHLYFYHHAGVVRAADYSNYSVDDHDGYKLYDDAGLVKLKQIAMYYELGLKRNEICELMKAPDYDMHRALDELQMQLEEKRRRLSMHISAIDQMRQIGTKNGLLDMFSGLSLEELGKNGLAFNESQLKENWLNSFNDTTLDAFGGIISVALDALVVTTSEHEQKQIINRFVRDAVDTLGFSGYLFSVSLFLAITGEGKMAEELAADLPANIGAEHGQLALECFKEDLDDLIGEIATIIAKHHESIGMPYDTPDVLDMLVEIKQALHCHFGINSKAEYTLVLNAMPIHDDSQGYLQFVISAMRYQLENNPAFF